MEYIGRIGNLCELARRLVEWVSKISPIRTMLSTLSRPRDAYKILMNTGLKSLEVSTVVDRVSGRLNLGRGSLGLGELSFMEEILLKARGSGILQMEKALGFQKILGMHQGRKL